MEYVNSSVQLINSHVDPWTIVGSFAGDVVDEPSPSQPASKSPSPAVPSVPATPAAPAATTPPTQTATAGKMPTNPIGQEICTRKILKMWHEIKMRVCVCPAKISLPLAL